jgi:hypothetical protein
MDSQLQFLPSPIPVPAYCVVRGVLPRKYWSQRNRAQADKEKDEHQWY